MRRTHRRAFLRGAAMVALAGCSANGSASQSLQNAVQVAQNIIVACQQYVPQFAILYPTQLNAAMVAKLNGWLSAAQADLSVLQTDLVKGISDLAGAQSLTAIEGYINQVFAALQPIITIAAGSGSPAAIILQDAMLSLPLIEAFINSAIPVAPAPTPASLKLAAKMAMKVPDHRSSQEAYADLVRRLGK